VGDPAAEAKSDNADFSIAVGMLKEIMECIDEVLEHVVSVPFALHFPALVVIARIADQRGKRIRRDGEESREGQSPSDVLNVWIQAAVLMDHDHSAQFLAVRCGLGQ